MVGGAKVVGRGNADYLGGSIRMLERLVGRWYEGGGDFLAHHIDAISAADV